MQPLSLTANLFSRLSPETREHSTGIERWDTNEKRQASEDCKKEKQTVKQSVNVYSFIMSNVLFYTAFSLTLWK